MAVYVMNVEVENGYELFMKKKNGDLVDHGDIKFVIPSVDECIGRCLIRLAPDHRM